MRPTWLTSSKALRPLAFVSMTLVLLGLLAWSFAYLPHHPVHGHPIAASTGSAHAGPPWIYGTETARFTLVEYADLECPYCQAYFPTLRQWIDAHPEVNWQWHHLPLSVHEPATSREARFAECVGETGGHVAFWQAVAWIYQHTRSDGQGLPTDVQYPFKSATLQTCLDSARPDALIRSEAEEAAHDDIAVTPTLRLLDHQTSKTLVLSGPVEGDALLSAIDLLVAQAAGAEPVESQKPSFASH
jgi:protein-disulfide isomerase